MRASFVPATLLGALLGATSASAQSATLVDRRPAVGGYAGLESRFGNVHGEARVLAGAEFALLLDHRLSIGVAGTGMSVRDDDGSDDARLRMGYGGVRVGWRVRHASVVHPTVELLLGGGGARHDDAGEDTETFFVAEPTLGVEANVARWLRAAAGVSYRHVGGLSHPALRDADLRGASVHVGLRAGRF